MAIATVNRFRSRRGRALAKVIASLARHLGRDVTVLDIGGRAAYWGNVGFDGVAAIEVMNHSERELVTDLPEGAPEGVFSFKVGDARDLGDYPDASVDLVHSNSVIEHVGGWDDMAAMAREAMRVGRAGWVQTPAWSFPIEPHFQVPFMHWFGRPMQARMMRFVADRGQRRNDIAERRRRIEAINLLARPEVEALFPGRPIYVERVVLAKSYSVYWLPEGVATAL